ncbi:YeiH family protein [Rubinisphaera brasiliensis]|uniref:Uncharacterized protein family UPF0324 n=1 Tax=Rubinisphaera brasiliensis (strain ATCC 49424 / DSM 5305 / JCM 21570 / IAM 15109 / NBRC 103401 / IFAM 1448) TaxID=756272 RepID=F0STF3_RUBBR|nr:putative sulfate exporter family transporter [Rubinisphaera brasiliensis]ADY60415.1 Uncharacterized protein family UPF0324 [Rubinisphaera brasiliensis DSM 5305]
MNSDQPSDPVSPATTENSASDNTAAEIVTAEKPVSTWQQMKTAEDWWAIWIGGFLLVFCLASVLAYVPSNLGEQIEEAKAAGEKFTLTNPLKNVFTKPGSWGQLPPKNKEGSEAETTEPVDYYGNPIDAFWSGDKSRLPGILCVFGLALVLFGLAISAAGGNFWGFAGGFTFVFVLATGAYLLASQAYVKHYNLEYALWALAAGLLISNTVGTPRFARPALRTELFIKTGLVILGAEVLISRLIELGVPGIFVAWVVTPIVLISTYAFGQKVLKIESRSLNMVISADMSVCGVSAAIATAAACKAKKEELSFAVGLSLTFTVIMMIVLPAVIKMLGLSPVLGGAWLGGTIDSTGAVAAAGGMLDDIALEVAATVKMIQNILIGVTAFGVATYWVTCVEAKKDENGAGVKPDAGEIWRRFPKFVLGFVAASIVFSIVYGAWEHGPLLVETVVKDSTKTLRGWFFCLAFVSIGLETNFRELAKFLKGGKPLILYVCGQSLNLVLTLFMAWLMFEVVFREMTDNLLGR